MPQQVNFVGLGVMGLPMAANLVKAGFAVTAHTRSEASRERARSRGINVVGDRSELPRTPDFTVTVLPDSPDVNAVLFGPDGLADRTEASLFVDMSTIAPDAARTIGERLSSNGHRFLDAPVSGGEAGAVNGQLSIMVGGHSGDFARASRLFEALGTTVVHVGGTGAGQVTKAANQMVVAGNLAILAEALVFIEHHGIDAATALRVIAGGLAGSAVLDRKSPAMLGGDFTPGFRLTLHDKDLRIVGEAAAQLGITLTVNDLITGIVRQLVDSGRGGFDHSALVLAAREAASTGPLTTSVSSIG
jgi:2-hydroxy-3-oxopropionate reductase